MTSKAVLQALAVAAEELGDRLTLAEILSRIREENTKIAEDQADRLLADLRVPRRFRLRGLLDGEVLP